jgi:hypothetical protein
MESDVATFVSVLPRLYTSEARAMMMTRLRAAALSIATRRASGRVGWQIM